MELVEYEAGRLYFLSSNAVPGAKSGLRDGQQDLADSLLRIEYIHVENEFPYQNFYADFGPLHLAHVFAFARRLQALLAGATASEGESSADDNQHDADARECRVCVFASLVPQHRANAVCLLGCWAVLFREWSAERASAPFKHLRLPCFHDASPSVDTFGLSVLHVLRGLERAVQCGVFSGNVDDFDEAAFLDDMDPNKRDLTWITPCVCAFAGPQSQPNWFGRPRPQEYIEYFRRTDIKVIVRLNSPKYDKEVFVRAGIEVIDLYFPDGTCPSESTLRHFLAICESNIHRKIAVHCKAGLGRTGTLIACYLMYRHQFSAEEAIGWLRLCRPGSVIGEQQQYLRELATRFCWFGERDKEKGYSSKSDQECPEVVMDEDREQSLAAMQPTKGIASRKSGHIVSSSLSQKKLSSSLPPRIPGRRLGQVTAAPVGPSHSKPTQGDLLLLRKHVMPVGSSLALPPPQEHVI